MSSAFLDNGQGRVRCCQAPTGPASIAQGDPDARQSQRPTLDRQFQAEPGRAELVYSKPPPGELNAEQKALLKLRPRRLTQSQKLEYRRAVIEAPWLQPGDRELLVQWVEAGTRYRTASTAFTALLADPEFAMPGSEVSKSAGAISRLCHRETAALISLAQRLGFSPTARNALGLEAKPPADAEDDPWRQLRLIPKG
jgi:phage terminase small subunit